MNSGFRDKIQNLQLTLLQDYLEICMSGAYGEQWINEVINLCEIKLRSEPKNHTYKNVVDIKRNKGAVMVTKRSFDITILHALLRFDFIYKCFVSDRDIFSNYIRDITQDKNKLASHISDLEDRYLIQKLERDCLLHVRDFLLYLERSGWTGGEKDVYLSKYNKEIEMLEQILSSNKSSKKVRINVSVIDDKGFIIPGFKMNLLTNNGELVNSWRTDDEPFITLLEPGHYVLKEVRPAQNYKRGEDTQYEVTETDIVQSFVKKVTINISDSDLFKKALSSLTSGLGKKEGTSLLRSLEEKNHLQSLLVLSFLYKTGIACEQDMKKGSELIDFAGFQSDEATWFDEAESLSGQEKYNEAVAFYLGYSQRYDKPEGYYEAGRIFLKKIKNYELCKKCFELSSKMGYESAKTPYEYLNNINEEEFMKI